jgi:hypothetical protein
MRANSVIALQDILDTQLIWRRKEISTLFIVAKSSDFAAQNSIIRASVPLLYAHWEGFSRECFSRYLEFVSYKRIKFKNLDPSFLFIASLPSLNQIKSSGIKDSLEILKSLLMRNESVNKDAFRKRIDTKANLRSDVICDLLVFCGLDGSLFKDDISFIDKELCDPRNEIAHGSGSSPTLEVFSERRNRTFELMAKLQTAVVNAAINSNFKAAA